MDSGRDEISVISRRQPVRMTAVAASAMVALLALAGCVPSGSTSSASSASSSSVPTASATPSSTPLPTPDPLMLPGCDTLLPLTTAKSLFSPDTQLFTEQNSVTLYGGELAEVVTAVNDATITKNCIWGIPNSDGFFSLVVADISVPDATDLKSALLSGGYLGVTSNNVTTLEFATESEVSGLGYTHIFVGDLWIYVSGSSVDLTTNIANTVLDEVRLANPTRIY